MKFRALLLLLTFAAAVLHAAPPTVALVGTNDGLAKIVAESGAPTAPAESAEVILVAGADADRAAVEAAAKRGAGIVLVGSAIEAGEWLKPIVGAAWTPKSRKFASQMMLYPLTDAHAITRGASPFDLADLTPYDLDLDPAIQVVGSAFTPKATGRRDSRAPEKLDRANVYDVQPQMWTFEKEGQHRAFVLLQGGRDALNHASIRTFILRGIAWTAKREQVDELVKKEDLATLRYPVGGPRLAADTAKSFDLTPGFKATAIASEPLINKPIAMQWDARGRLWVAETPEYPNGRRPLTDEPWRETSVLKPHEYDREATDRISILEDTDGDGVMDKKTVFCTGLELITGFCLYRDGVLVVSQPDIAYIHGEGANQRVERLFTGFTPHDTHFVANHFMVGMDGWVYANTGGGADVTSVTHPGVKARISSGIFRFRPDGSAIEQVGSKGGNAFGMDITNDGELYFSQATSGNPVQHVVLPEWILAKGKIGNAGSVQSVLEQRKVNRPDMPTRVPYMQIDQVGSYSAATASTVQEDHTWPAEWRGVVFCTEPILDIIHVERLKAQGPSFTGELVNKDREWLRANDWWFFPVSVQFGPDGAMYVLDFYNPIVAHSDSRGPKHGSANATVRPDREHYFGRIYRIQHEQAAEVKVPDLSKADVAGLVAAFSDPTKRTRFTAQRLLLERVDAATAVPALTALAASGQPEASRILALWTLQQLGALKPEMLQAALKDTAAGIQKTALQIVEAQGAKSSVDVAALLKSEDPRVRLLALRAMASSPLTPESAAQLLAILPALEDDYSRSAATAAASANAEPVLLAALAANTAPSNALLDLAASLARTLTERKDTSALVRIVEGAAKTPPPSAPLAIAVLEALGGKLPAFDAPAPAALGTALQALLKSSDIRLAASALPIAAAWGPEPAMRALVAQKNGELLAVAADSKQPDAVRAATIQALLRIRRDHTANAEAVIALLKSGVSDGLALDSIAALLATGDDSLGTALVKLLPHLNPLGQTALFDGLTSRSTWTNAALDALETKAWPVTLLGPARLSKLRLHPDEAIRARAVKVIDALGGGTSSEKDSLIAKLEAEIEKGSGDAAKGRALYGAACATCHTFRSEGSHVGPRLDGIGVHGTHELLVHILDPSRVVDNEHRTWN
ncbi:MAG: PVC-type heme-binding CxxCH protein, partial [Chthoniobacteraceae bacterium]